MPANQDPVVPDFKYKNITISGLPGCGSTTLLTLLRENEVMRFSGWKGFSGGEFMRAYAEEKGLFDGSKKIHHSATHYEDEFDFKVDFGMREKLQSEEHWILEAWLSGFMAQDVKGTLKVLMTCSDDAVRIDRLVNRDRVSVDEAKEHIWARYRENLEKWQRMYGKYWEEWVVGRGLVKPTDPIDFWRPELYDIVIDTYSTNQQEAAERVLHAIIE
jgi:cytidylate kinase